MASSRENLHPWLISAAFSILWFTQFCHAEAPLDPASIDFFENRIRPVLAGHCYACHSAAAAAKGKLKGELLLDTRDGLLKGGKSGPAIVPGKVEQSRLIEAVRYGNEDLQMPPKDRLPAAMVADLQKWVAMGAPDPRTGTAPPSGPRVIDVEAGRKFWAFEPLHRAAPPDFNPIDRPWVRTDIDRFVLAAQAAKGLHPNGMVARQKLIRRACFDLLGVPPTPQEIDAFVNDSSPSAYEKVLDRLLDSPRYGERWARHWLDVARFAESDGFEHDSDRPAAYQYRDFVIRAFNADMPFDRFVQLQIAGDEIAPGDWQAMAATGFLTAGVFPTQITEKEFEFTRYNQLDDMAATTASAMLGLTVGCARCHDHKFDPIPTADYYRFIATFGSAIRSDVDLDTNPPELRAKNRIAWEKKVGDLSAKVDAAEAQANKLGWRKLLEDAATSKVEWFVLNFESATSAKGTHLAALADGSIFASGNIPPKETYTLVAKTGAERIAALRLEALTDDRLPHGGPGTADNGNFALTEIEVSASPLAADKSEKAKIVSAIATHEQNKTDLSIASAFDGKSATGWAVDNGGIGKSQAAIFRFDRPIEFPGGATLTIKLHFDHSSAKHLIGRSRFAISSEPDASAFTGHEGPDAALARILAKMDAGEAVSPAERAAAGKWTAMQSAEYRELADEFSSLKDRGPDRDIAKVQVTSEGLPPVKNYADERGYPHFYPTTYLLRRGDPNNKVEPVSFSFPRVLMRGGMDESHWKTSPPPDSKLSYRRTALARWLTDVDHGAGNLLARVIVNRLWQHHFGQGIVATPNDFGAQGDRPTNPLLLDWLADDLVEHGWQLKRLQKLMMSSAVYMQDAASSPDRDAIDPHDVYLWRWQPRRLEAEPIRDSLLFVAGMLDDRMFGPGTLDQSSRRRSIYFTVKRSQLIPMMMVLDWPEALNSIGSRPTTTVAPQALLFMNSPQAREYAAGFARRARSAAQRDSIERAYRMAFGRAPAPAEADAAGAFIDAQTSRYAQSNAADGPMLALTDFCQALMSSNEFVYVD